MTAKHESQDPAFRSILKEVGELLLGGHSHARFEKAIKDFPAVARGTVLDGLPYSAWQVLEHIRRAQRYMLEFTKHHHSHPSEAAPQELKWPRDYWSKETAPPDDAAWDKLVETIVRDREELSELLSNATKQSLVRAPGPGRRKTMLRLALQVSDHNAYHIGQLVLMRRLLGNWHRTKESNLSKPIGSK
jgi:hypothetical protein